MASYDWTDKNRRELNKSLADIRAALERMERIAADNFFYENLWDAVHEADDAINGEGQ